MTPPGLASYRVEWWRPLAGGEWAGSWDLCDDGVAARTTAMAALAGGQQPGLALLVAIDAEGRELARAAVDVDELLGWTPDTQLLPVASRDPASLPPLGRDDVEGSTLATCRDALVQAADAGLLEAGLVTPLVEIIQQAFSGIGPAAGDA